MTGFDIAGILIGLTGLFFGLRTPAAYQAYAKAYAVSAQNVEKLTERLTKLEKRYSITMVYMIELVESHRRHNVKPPNPPDELKSDPDIIRLFAQHKRTRK